MYTCFHVLSWRRIFFFRSSMSCCRWSSSLCVPATVVRAWEVYCLMAWRRRITETGDGWGSSAKLLVTWSEKLWYPSKQWLIITFTYHFPSFKRQIWSHPWPVNPGGGSWPWDRRLAFERLLAFRIPCGAHGEVTIWPPEMDGWIILNNVKYGYYVVIISYVLLYTNTN